MAQKLIKRDAGLRAQLFHEGDKGLRGVTFMRSSGSRGNCLYVAVLDENGKRKPRTSYTLDGADFYDKWTRACGNIAEYYNVDLDGPLYMEMIRSADAFLARYNLNLTEVITQQVRTHEL